MISVDHMEAKHEEVLPIIFMDWTNFDDRWILLGDRHITIQWTSKSIICFSFRLVCIHACLYSKQAVCLGLPAVNIKVRIQNAYCFHRNTQTTTPRFFNTEVINVEVFFFLIYQI